MWKNRTLFQKIFLGTLLLVFMTLVIYHSFNLYYQYRQNEKSTIEDVSELSETINNVLEEYIGQIEGTISSIYYELYQNESGALSTFLSDSDNIDIEAKLKQNQELQEFFSQLFLMRKDFVDVYVYTDTENQFMYSTYGGKIMDYSPEGQEWYTETIQKGGKTHVVINQIPEHITYKKPVIGLSRMIKNVNNENIAQNTVVRLDFTMQNLENLIDAYLVNEDTTVLIADDNEDIVYQSGVPLNFRDESEKDRFLNEKSSKHKLGKESYIFAGSQITAYDWSVIIATNTKHVLNLTKDYLIITVMIAIFLILLTAAISYAYDKNMTKPIQELERGMQYIQKGEFDIALMRTTDDELGQLVDAFNTMSRKTKTLIQEKYEEELEKKEAQFQFLQAQIDPHFIFNTLQIISSMAVVKQLPEIENVSNSLARLIRYSISGEDKLILLKEELKNVKSYLEIQKIRFKNRLTYDMQLECAVDNIYIIKLTLQPIVENGISHGLESMTNSGKIMIRVYWENDMIIEISDNGLGMTKEELDMLLRRINGEAEHSTENSGEEKKINREQQETTMKGKGNHVGLRNINQRLKMYYGEQYKLSIRSEKGRGTVVTVKIPGSRGTENEENVDC